MDPPAQDSPKHILNILCDDCIEEIFRRIFVIEDYLNMAEVCKRFQKIAKNCFRLQFKSELWLNRCESNNIQPTMYTVSSERVIAFLNMFGTSIQHLRLISSSNQEHDDEIFKLIVKFTTKTLKSLSICGYNADFAQIHFSALENMYLCKALVTNFEYIPPLKTLSISMIDDARRVIRAYPRLECLKLLSYSNVTDDIVYDFLSLNPHLKRLEIDNGDKKYHEDNVLTPLILRTIGSHSINLVELELSSFRWAVTQRVCLMFNINLPYLGALRQLKVIKITLYSAITFKILINTFGENEVPVEEIILYFHFSKVNDPCDHMLTIKDLKILKICGKDYRYIDFFNEMLLNVMKTQTALEELTMDFRNKDVSLPIERIGYMLEYGKSLKKFLCHIGNLKYNLKSFESILC